MQDFITGGNWGKVYGSLSLLFFTIAYKSKIISQWKVFFKMLSNCKLRGVFNFVTLKISYFHKYLKHNKNVQYS